MVKVAQMVVVLVLALQSAASAEELAPFHIEADGTRYEITLGPEQASLSEVSVYFTSRGNSSNAVIFEVEGPSGMRGKVDGRLVGKSENSDRLDRTSAVPWEPFTVRDPAGRERQEFMLDEAAEGSPIRRLYHLHKDACLPRGSSTYVSRLMLDLSHIDRRRFEEEFTVRVAMQELPFRGSRVASIKPVADGKYRGEPILLMGTISYGEEYVNIVRRTRGRRVSHKRTRVVKYVSYRGRTLSLARLRGLLRGGRATCELSNGGYIYGVCFSLVARRQVTNGYPS